MAALSWRHIIMISQNKKNEWAQLEWISWHYKNIVKSKTKSYQSKKKEVIEYLDNIKKMVIHSYYK